MKSEPVITADVVVAVLFAGGAALMSFGVVKWNSEQIASLKNLVILVVPVLVYAYGTYWKRSRVTPV